jgi:xylose isomerase
MEAARSTRYAGWQSADAKAMLGQDLETVAASVLAKGTNPQPVSGRQERLENMWNKYV